MITSDREVWLDTMMREELGYRKRRDEPGARRRLNTRRVRRRGVPAAWRVRLRPGHAGLIVAPPFVWSAVLAGLAFLIVGALKARVVDQPAWRSALETLAIGGGAAVLAYVLGAALQGVA